MGAASAYAFSCLVRIAGLERIYKNCCRLQKASLALGSGSDSIVISYKRARNDFLPCRVCVLEFDTLLGF